METKHLVNIDFNKFRGAFREYVRAKAIQADSTIVYIANGQLIEEDPKSKKITILRDSFTSS